MNVFSRFLFVAMLGSISLVSCDPAKEFATEIKTIDSCIAELDTLDQLYKGIEFDSLSFMLAHINENEELLKNNYKSDTINLELGVLMNNCKGVRKSMKNIEGNRKSLADEIAALNVQFKNLKADILNGALDKEQIAEYLLEERQALATLDNSFMSFYENQRMQSQVYYYAVPKVDEYIKTLNITGEDSTQ